MADETRMMVCELNLRPRQQGKAELIEAGTPFDEALMDVHTKDVLIEQGNLRYVEDTTSVPDKPLTSAQKAAATRKAKKEQADALVTAIKDKFGVEVDTKKFKTVPKLQDEYDRLKKEYAPKGFFKEVAEDLEGFNLDELDARHAQICAENELDAPEPFESIEQGIAKLTGQPEE